MGLISQANLEARLGRSLNANEANAFTIINGANQAYVERVIIGSGVESASVTARYYDGNLQHIPIDPCTDVASIKLVDEDEVVTETIDSSDYTLEPRSRTLKTELRYRYGKFPRGINVVQVNAKHSIYADTDILNIVKDALLQALESEINNTDNIKRRSIEGYSVEYAGTETKDALSKLKGLFPSII